MLRRAPVALTPVPLSERASVPTVIFPWSCRAAPEETVVLPEVEPRALACWMFKTPALTLVVPVYALEPERVSVPAPDLVRLPLPEMVLERVMFPLLRLIASVPLFVMALLEEIEPVVPPSPIWSVPALIVVAPV